MPRNNWKLRNEIEEMKTKKWKRGKWKGRKENEEKKTKIWKWWNEKDEMNMKKLKRRNAKE